jgi:hypothetical protein
VDLLARLCGLFMLWLYRGRWHKEEFAGTGDIGDTMSVGEQPIVANALEAPGEDVHQKAADELVR